MFSTGLARPPRAAARQLHEPGRAPQRRPPPVARRARSLSYERVLAWSLLASAALHVLFVLLSPALVRIGPPPGESSLPDTRPVVRQALQLIDPVIATDASEERPDELSTRRETPEERRTDAPARVVVPAVGAPEPGVPPEEAGGAASVRDLLRPGARDPRLWVNPKETPLPEASRHEQYMEHLQARIDAINDSIAGAAERERRATDWTVKDKSGRRWGLSPDGLHLGGVTVPLPMPVPTGDTQRLEEEREKQRQREEIRRQEEARKRREAQKKGSGEAREPGGREGDGGAAR